LRDFEIAPEQREALIEARAGRMALKRITLAVRAQALSESELLAELLTRFRELCHGAGLWPRYWSGAGKLANYLLSENRTLTAKQLTRLLPAEVAAEAKRAFYGGRFEVTAVGDVPGPVFGHDVNACFPAAMTALPCLRHGKWRQLAADDFSTLPADATFLARVSFDHPPGQFLCGLPVRKKGTLSVLYPMDGTGTYWSHELRSAERLGARIEYHSGWQLTKHCRCEMFSWVRELYQSRLAYGRDLRGETLKTAMAALYGKLIQRKGSGRYENYVWGGHLTATARAWINDVIAQAPESVIMIASDSVHTTRPLNVPLGEGLGEWKADTLERLFIVQSGLWWGAKKPRTRGLPVNLFEPHAGRFEQAWRVFRLAGHLTHPPVIEVPVSLFTGIRLAHARNDLSQSRQITAAGRPYSFFWAHKRGRAEWRKSYIRTWPLTSGEISLGHGESPDIVEELDQNRLELEALPDTLDLSIPFH
jgi:hypothetical protein